MTITCENNKITFLKHETFLLVINETNGKEMVVPNFDVPKNYSDLQAILFLGGASFIDLEITKLS